MDFSEEEEWNEEEMCPECREGVATVNGGWCAVCQKTSDIMQMDFSELPEGFWESDVSKQVTPRSIAIPRALLFYNTEPSAAMVQQCSSERMMEVKRCAKMQKSSLPVASAQACKIALCAGDSSLRNLT